VPGRYVIHRSRGDLLARSKKHTNGTAANIGYAAELWQMADALRGSMDSGEYKHVVLGLLFLKCISDAFEEKHANWKLTAPRCRSRESVLLSC
jgi:type I restriction enzyme M protein